VAVPDTALLLLLGTTEDLANHRGLLLSF
jgi:hypothetical protein